MTAWGESLAVVLRDVKYPMRWIGEGNWEVCVNTAAKDLEDYCYVVIRDGLIARTEWKHHSSKVTERIIYDRWNDCPIEGCSFEREHQAAIFDKPGFRGAGTAVPVFSLRTGQDFGIGEFRDLRPLVDWAAVTGQCIIQLLPVNDTTRKGEWKDSYPYSPVSSFALNPLYIHLQDLGIEETPEFKKQQEELNALPEIDYPRVFKAKMAFIRKAFEQYGVADMARPTFKKWLKDNSYWLEGYSSFCAERDGLEKEYYDWMQWHLERQFSEEATYARSKGLYFKGDLPIGVSADSAEARWCPELFNLDSSAGAPPDFFSADGQNWGFPTYNWDEMAKDNYAWWKWRLRKMSQFFDAFRIDHILGFFRIWEIPSSCKSGKDGHFNPALPYSAEEIQVLGLPIEKLFNEDPRHPGKYQPKISPDTADLSDWVRQRFAALHDDFFFRRHNEFWRLNAEKKLPELLGSTGMLACGEDLGMVPDCVPGVMDHERILSLEMKNMEKGRPWPYLSVCATSSHDMDTLRMQYASRCGADPEPWEVRRELWDHLNSASMLAIFPLQDWVALDGNLRRVDYMNERINQPADPNHHWRYRFHFDVRKLCKDEASGLRAEMEGLLKDSGRWLHY